MIRWLALMTAVAFGCVAYPMYVIRPFRAQGATELAIALVVRGWGPTLAIACAVGSVALLVRFWSRIHKAAVVLPLLTAAFAAAGQINIFERMFRPIDSLGNLPASQAQVDADDMVLAVTFGPTSRAYPIRMMGYHHIANDWVAGSPVVVTY